MSTKSSGCTAAAAVILGLAAGGCGTSSLDENSSCRDFLQADRAEQDKAVARVAEKLNVKGVQSPLARPNIDYICGNEPNASLGGAVRDSGTP